ncbi:Small ubiquitin-related modifier 3-like SUMO-3-A [Takifugu flavidus]|uniref:Small ubiquitin-related modifier 3-like SUMO-3-A n=1 Tax=Takifugu flavidus TaxID=433684 RepID=A0A5C6PP58_9TELE|nr:Small ubiquitin-related modifier 3-like SUMO-3-A [Takifugu flavidus]
MPVAGRLSALLLAWILCAVTGSSEAQTPAPESRPCALSNSSCDECLKNVSKLCTDYPVGKVLPPQSLCPLNDARWGVCWVNFQILIITMSVLAGVIIIGVLVCCCFCCCKCEKVGLIDGGLLLQEGVKTENDHINLKVAGQDGSVVQFKIKRHTALNKLMKAYCERQGLSMRQIRFRFDGQPINETDTPAQLEMEDEDTIDVFQQQTGGGCS